MARHNATDVMFVTCDQLLKEFYLAGQNPRDNVFIPSSLARSGVRLTQKGCPMPKSYE
jgi:hypothetical protein